MTEPKRALARGVRDAGYTIIGVATAIVRSCEAILRYERSVLRVSTMGSGQFGIAGFYLRLPRTLDASPVHLPDPMRFLREAANDLRFDDRS